MAFWAKHFEVNLWEDRASRSAPLCTVICQRCLRCCCCCVLVLFSDDDGTKWIKENWKFSSNISVREVKNYSFSHSHTHTYFQTGKRFLFISKILPIFDWIFKQAWLFIMITLDTYRVYLCKWFFEAFRSNKKLAMFFWTEF